jgi:hypothetical protein
MTLSLVSFQSRGCLPHVVADFGSAARVTAEVILARPGFDANAVAVVALRLVLDPPNFNPMTVPTGPVFGAAEPITGGPITVKGG